MDPISVYLPGIMFAFSAFLLSIMSPGPNVLAILGTSMSAGRQADIAARRSFRAAAIGLVDQAVLGRADFKNF